MTAHNILVLANSRQRLFSCSSIMDAALQGTTVRVIHSQSKCKNWICDNMDLALQHRFHVH